MKKTAHFLLLSLVYVAFISCESGQIECDQISSNIITEERDLEDFRGVVYNNIGDIKIAQSPEYFFRMTGPENVVQVTTTEITDNILEVGTDDDKCFNGLYDFVVEVSAPEYDLISLAGFGRIETVGPIETSSLRFDVLGIGEVEADFYVDSLFTTLSGSSDVDLGGVVGNHQIIASGDFELRSFPLETDNLFINHSGNGDMQVTAYETLTVRLSGVGSVFYQGNPDIQSEILGAGEIIDSN